MIFIYKTWARFCRRLHEDGVHSIPARQLLHHKPDGTYCVLKHDVETNVRKARRMAELEHKWGHCGSYYVQSYLMKDRKNIALLREMAQMGHEISYHYDVMDSNGGDIPKAIAEFECNCRLFEENGFHLETLCQHGNPVVERKGYTSNRDFFRNAEVQARFPGMTDIMVDFPQKAYGGTEYLYFSDAGRKFHLIYDPISNDIVPSNDKNLPFENLEELWQYVRTQHKNCIISTHPHRFESSWLKYVLKTAVFKVVRCAAKGMMKIPVLKKVMSKYYYLAKKI